MRALNLALAAGWPLARPLLARLDPERAHDLTLAALGRLPPGPPAPDDPRLRVRVLGLDLPNPLGLAAGFDKGARATGPLLRLGFGHVEAGGVTPRPQPGNPRPRAFRLAEDGAVINRYGLNSEGVAVVAARLAARGAGVVGVNLGANKDSPDRAADYAALARALAGHADYLTVNVSSPNTPGLRDLQGAAALGALVGGVVAARGGARTPVLVKLAPDLGQDDLPGVLDAALAAGAAGFVIANTTIARPPGLRSVHAAEAGGLSGRPVFGPSTRMLARARLHLGRDVPLVGVGGVGSAADAWAKLEAGADLVQLYSALIYEGPGLVARIKRGLLARLEAEGLASLAPVVGRRAEEVAAGGG